MTDYRGSNMAFMAEAHRKAHARDTQNDLAPQCSNCGLKAGDQLKSRIPISKLLLCSRCQGVQYCSKECQVSHWKEHKVHCKKMAKERKAYEEADRQLQESDIQKQIYSLADSYPDDLPGQARAFIGILENSKNNDMTTVACASRLGEDLDLLNECHKQGDSFYPVLRSLLEQDLVKIQQPAYKGKAIALPSWHMAMCILRHFPQESGYQKGGKPSNISSYSEERSVAYFSTCWQAHLAFSAGLWKASRQGSPDLYQVCKDFWRQLPVCLVHQSVARAIFLSDTPSDDNGDSQEPFSSFKSPRLKPLIGMLNLHNMADDLEGLTNQVAAILVIHARNIKNSNICSSAELERSITRRMDRFEKAQWREISLVVAKAMVDKKRQLSNDEFGRVIQKIRR